MCEVISLRNHTYTREGLLWRHARLLWAYCEVLDWWRRQCHLDRSWLLKFSLSSFLPGLNSEGGQCLIMLTRGGRFVITLCATIPDWIIKNDLWWHLFKAFDLPRFRAPLRGIHNTEIALALVWEVKDELPLIDCRVQLRFLGLLPQVRIAEIERGKSKLWWRFDDWVVRGIQVNCAAIRINNFKYLLFQISTPELLARHVYRTIFAVSEKDWARAGSNRNRRIFALVNHYLNNFSNLEVPT